MDIQHIELAQDKRSQFIPKKTTNKRLAKKELQPDRCNCCKSDQLILKSGNYKDGYICNYCGYKYEPQDYYAASYNSTTETAQLEPLEVLRPALSWLNNKELRILESGCQNERIIKKLQDRGHEVESLSPLGFKNSSFEQESFDLIYASKAFEKSENPFAQLREYFSFLKEDGLLVIYGDVNQSNDDSERQVSSFTYTAFEAMMDRLDKDIIYKNPSLIIARAAL